MYSDGVLFLLSRVKWRQGANVFITILNVSALLLCLEEGWVGCNGVATHLHADLMEWHCGKHVATHLHTVEGVGQGVIVCLC